MISIRRVQTAADFHAVSQFRYRIYVEEMRRPQKDADHNAKTIVDALDTFGCLYAAWDGTTVVGRLCLHEVTGQRTTEQTGNREL